jgi:hypothetical protein
MVDIGGNDNNIRLSYSGEELKLSEGEDCAVLPLLKNPIVKLNNNNEMNQELMSIALMLGMPAESTLADVQKQVNALLEHKKTNEDLRNEIKTLEDRLEGIQLSGITAMVDEAVKAGKFTADKKNHFVELGKKVGAESLKLTLDSMSPSMKPSSLIDKTPAPSSEKQYKSWSEVPEEDLKLLRKENPELYKKLYKAEFGCDCKI